MAAITRTHLTTCLVLLAVAAQARAAAPSFEREVGPLLRERCLKCHSGKRPRGDLDLTRQATLMAGGASGAVVRPSHSGESLLFQHVRDGKMPPKRPLGAAEVELLRRWIDAGAPWEGPALTLAGQAEARRAGPDWWSLQPVRRPPLPRVSRPGWCRTPLDAFVLARLEADGLAPAPEADRRTLLRRLTLDLTGLLPTPEEIDAFAADGAPDAYERVVERLLASPAYGERWGRHWLDVVRFAESHGYEMNTLRPSAWPYRDYVIRAVNRDVPYPQFVREQLASDAPGGDLLTEAATGFLVGGPHDLVVNATVEGKRQQRMDDLFDIVSTTGTTFLGLTVGCARCHDHKFDPITQKDYYGLQAVFAGVEHEERAVTAQASGPGGKPASERVYAGRFREPEPTYVLKRGDPMQKLDEVGPSGIGAVRPTFVLNPGAGERQRRLTLAEWIVSPDNPLTARVLVNRVWHWHFGQGLVRTPSDFGSNGDRPSHPELLDWLAQDFMDGGWRLKRLHRRIVLSAAYRQSSRIADCGLRIADSTTRPTATSLPTSSSNPQSTIRNPQSIDAGNRLLWRYPPRRLEAEAIRDTMLQVSGALDRRMGGPGYHLWDYSGYVIVFKPKATLGPEALRRMVYQFKPRLQQDGTFGAFDCPDATAAAPRRNASTTALQALNLLNDPFVHGQAERFADRLRREAGDRPEAQVRRAFRLAFGREPSAREAGASLRLVRDHGLAVLCRVLFNANEFVFVN